jgi:hypothetical protein
MKSIITIFFVLIAFHFSAQQIVPLNSITDQLVVKSVNTNSKSLKDTLYYQDFAGGIPSGWTVTNTGASGNEWLWSNSAPGGQYSWNIGLVNSTSKANGFMSLPSDMYNSPLTSTPDAMNTWFSSPAIAIKPSSFVEISWQQSSRYCCNLTDEVVMEVSHNNVSWVAYDATMGRASNVAVPAASTASAEVVTYDVSQVISNLSTMYVRFRSTGPTHYYWMIDDLLVLTNSTVGLEEPLIPNNLFSIVPNPNKGIFSVELNSLPQNLVLVQVLSSLGQVVFEGYQNRDQINLDLSNQSPGVYFLSIGEGKNRKIEKLIVQ